MQNAIAEKLSENPVIAAVAEPECLPRALASDCTVVFLLSGDILNIGAMVDAVKGAGKAAMVHLDLIEGLSGREIAVDAIHAMTRADGIISTRAAQIKRARQLGLTTIQRGFLLDSRSVRSLQAQAAQGRPDLCGDPPRPHPARDRRAFPEHERAHHRGRAHQEQGGGRRGAQRGRGSRLHHGGGRLGALDPPDD